MLSAGIDTVVLGCTHYPFVIPLIQEIVGPDVRVIDPAPAVARQAARLIREGDLGGASDGAGEIRYITSGGRSEFKRLISQLLNLDAAVAKFDWEEV
jgi:glutamate racemase